MNGPHPPLRGTIGRLVGHGCAVPHFSWAGVRHGAAVPYKR